MRINWFSPLSPAKTEIGHYTARLLPELSRRVDVTLWTDQLGWDRSLHRFARIRQYSLNDIRWREVESADATFYHIGNNGLFHYSIWRISLQHPGIIVLHDIRLHQFFAHCFRTVQNDRNGYVAAMEANYGTAGQRDAELFWDGKLSIDYLIERYPLTPLALENAIAAVVHTQPAYTFLRQHGITPAFCSPLSYPARSHPDRKRAPSDRRRKLIVFGYIHENRRIDSILRALAGFPDQDRLVLDIYGEVSNPERIRSLISQLNLGQLVKVHGFVPESELDAALDRADLCLNLRYPSVGEASASQLRIWDHSLPALVTRTGWYGTQSEDVAAFVSIENEVADIQCHFASLLAEPEKFAQIGRRGRQLLERDHHPKDYARFIQDLVCRASDLRSRFAGLQLSDRVADEIAPWISEPALDLPLGKAAQEIVRALGTVPQADAVESPHIGAGRVGPHAQNAS